jgi:hypothetical protein
VPVRRQGIHVAPGENHAAHKLYWECGAVTRMRWVAAWSLLTRRAMNPSAMSRTVSVLAFGALGALSAVTFSPGVCSAQEATSIPPIASIASIASSARAVVARAALDAPRQDQASALPSALEDHGHISLVMQSLYATTVVVQGLDAQSTFKALDAGAVESNSLVKPLASNRPAFVALKVGMSAAFIYAGHDLSKRHKIGAILALGLVNSVYTAIALHNYHVAYVMDTRR